MPEPWSGMNLSRRALLKILAGSAGSAISPAVLGNESSPHGVSHVAHLSRTGTTTVSMAPHFFNSEQLETVAAVCETIIPSDEHSSGAIAARVPQYVDDLIADSDEARKKLWVQGLAALDKMAEIQYGKKFAKCTMDQQIALTEKIGTNEENPSTLEERFFVAAKEVTVDGYYTSEIGIHEELQYQGNTVVLDFKGCDHNEHKIGIK